MRLLPLLAISSFAFGQENLYEEYCIDCHNFESFSGGFELEGMNTYDIARNPELAEKIIKRLQSGLMPPADQPRPSYAETQYLARSLEAAVDSYSHPHFPAPGLHRLNRTEYSNAVYDLLGVRVDATKFLPADDSSHGFDNIADVLTSSPALLEAYLSAAGKISKFALGLDTEPTLAVFDAPPDTSQNSHIEGLPFGTRGGLLIEYNFPSDGKYVFTVKGMTGYFTRVLGNVKGEQLEVTIDGERVYLYDWDEEIGDKEGLGGKTPEIFITGGYHKVGVTFISTSDLPDTGLNASFVRTMNSPGAISGYTFYPHVGQVFIEGPFEGVRSYNTESRDKILECYPWELSQEEACSDKIINTLATKAYRRLVTEEEFNTLKEFYKIGREEGGDFDHGIQSVIQRILADSNFIFRSEKPNQEQISDIELASRLSFFLWSTIPDDELLDLAIENKLHDREVLQQQVSRMLADSKSSSFIKNFTGQWLNTRGMTAKEPVVELFPDFDSTLRESFTKEIELFFESIVREDRSVMDLLDADYSFLNERLAKHYGVEGVYGSNFRRVQIPDNRKGLLGKGALLTLTSEAGRTSPVKRGKWFLETFYGISPPDPPPGVETDLEPVDGESLTLRQRLEAHRADPSCAACHKLFEPMGIAMENFDAVGRWRTEDSGISIDATGVTPEGIMLDGALSLQFLIALKQDMFAENIINKMVTYALGRGVEVEDMPLVREIRESSRQQDFRFSSIVMGIVLSPAFTINS